MRQQIRPCVARKSTPFNFFQLRVADKPDATRLRQYRVAVVVAEVFLDPPIVVVAAAATALVVAIFVVVVVLVGGVPTPPLPRLLSPVVPSSAAVTFHSSASTFA